MNELTHDVDVIPLSDLGWNATFSQQLDIDEYEACLPVRVMSVHRNALTVRGAEVSARIPPLFGDSEEDQSTVGDWLLIDPETGTALRRLDRISLFKRSAPGSERRVQLIAANVNTLFIVTSCNADFNVARLERYLALSHEAGVTPVIVLTKSDLCDDPDDYARQAAALMPNLFVEVLNAKNPDEVERLRSWCGRGQTVAFAGSSGVGKSTLVNTLSGELRAATADIREDDAKGRHTTTSRALHRLPAGGWLLDTPGMRELGLTDARAGLDEVFADVTELAQNCKFSDCAHDTEPGCAVQAALAAGTLDAARVQRWRKLLAEDSFNSATLAERRVRDRAFGKMVKSAVSKKRR